METLIRSLSFNLNLVDFNLKYGGVFFSDGDFNLKYCWYYVFSDGDFNSKGKRNLVFFVFVCYCY
ncbi:hypothetical protein RHMOL_Rhmol12G0174500 [Rhododendron molle]|uniref:Uncharacterized protein n=1 Tax=Rhododendron molle TaxID=49168 RepID=A0ACC0LJH6_RHOML|nr:hypothetical protein RHMOL_Rhmol12G0174500 [Rhododendron molle]